jgi:hypothetical protein
MLGRETKDGEFAKFASVVVGKTHSRSTATISNARIVAAQRPPVESAAERPPMFLNLRPGTVLILGAPREEAFGRETVARDRYMNNRPTEEGLIRPVDEQ